MQTPLVSNVTTGCNVVITLGQATITKQADAIPTKVGAGEVLRIRIL